LLTFFFRQMASVIERGHLFIAQPPLYKVTRGKTSLYCKDERALEDYLIETGCDGALLRLHTGEERSSRDLQTLVEDARSLRQTLLGLQGRYDLNVLEQAAIAGALNKEAALSDNAAEIAHTLATRLDAIGDEIERGWHGHVQDDGFVLERTLRGVTHRCVLDNGLLQSQEARHLHAHAGSLAEVFQKPATLTRRSDSYSISGPLSLFDAVATTARKGIQLQRYKGLGEMNPDQLWETTLDRSNRSLLQVTIKDAIEADDLFTKLMGDVVEPRREFIQDNALNVANLDV
jgi:DNA gyrase subunit B